MAGFVHDVLVKYAVHYQSCLALETKGLLLWWIIEKALQVLFLWWHLQARMPEKSHHPSWRGRTGIHIADALLSVRPTKPDTERKKLLNSFTVFAIIFHIRYPTHLHHSASNKQNHKVSQHHSPRYMPLWYPVRLINKLIASQAKLRIDNSLWHGNVVSSFMKNTLF